MDKLHKLNEILKKVEKPGRYLGQEWNEIKKDPGKARVKIGLVFPDLYEVGMSYLGQKILYHILNNKPAVLAERIFTPWLDLEKELRKNNLPLFSLENKIPVFEFDLLGFSLLYELNYTNILTVLDLGNIPFLSKDRNLGYPLIVGGGPAAFNPEPLAPIFDLFLIGDGEEAFKEVIEKYMFLKKNSTSKQKIKEELAGIKGVYIPSLYHSYLPTNSSLQIVKPSSPKVPYPVEKRVLYPFQKAPFPEKTIVPNTKVIFDRVAVEVARGCFQKCRFCQAASIYFPPRIKDPQYVLNNVLHSLNLSGYQDCSLTSLSISDYPYLDEILEALMGELAEKRISLSLPSLRPKGLTSELAENILKVRKTGFTLVPEAGTERLRGVINKNIKDEQILEAAQNAFSLGWRLLKLYYMVGLPTEKEEDLESIVRMVKELIKMGKDILGNPPKINLSISSFIPKPHTPFQWLRVESKQKLQEKHGYIKSKLKKYPFVKFKENDHRSFVLEVIFSRGDRRLTPVLINAWKNGARFDSWSDVFNFKVWEKAFQSERVDYSIYLGPLNEKAALPWDHLFTGIKKSHLLQELKKALREKETLSCVKRDCQKCQGCTLQTYYQKEFPSKSLQIPHYKFYLGKKTDEICRYQATYTKFHPASLLSHKDLTNIIQRTLRRSGIQIIHTQGFHPKMKLSFPPPLSLGMEGKREILEFKSFYDFYEDEFLSRINRFVPAGIKFLRLERLKNFYPSLNERIDKMIYSLDLENKEVKKAVEEMCKQKKIDNKNYISALKDFFRDYLRTYKNEALHQIKVQEKTGLIYISLKHNHHRSVSPTKVLKSILGREIPVYSIVREKIKLKI